MLLCPMQFRLPGFLFSAARKPSTSARLNPAAPLLQKSAQAVLRRLQARPRSAAAVAQGAGDQQSAEASKLSQYYTHLKTRISLRRAAASPSPSMATVFRPRLGHALSLVGSRFSSSWGSLKAKVDATAAAARSAGKDQLASAAQAMGSKINAAQQGAQDAVGRVSDSVHGTMQSAQSEVYHAMKVVASNAPFVQAAKRRYNRVVNVAVFILSSGLAVQAFPLHYAVGIGCLTVVLRYVLNRPGTVLLVMCSATVLAVEAYLALVAPEDRPPAVRKVLLFLHRRDEEQARHKNGFPDRWM